MDTSNVASNVAEAAGSAGQGFLGELKKIGQTAFSQLIGANTAQVPGEGELKRMKMSDDEFSKAEIAALRAKIASMYQSYDSLKKKEEKLEEEQQQQEEEFKKLEEINELRQSGNAVNVDVKTAIGKASAETGKSYGAE